MVQDSANAGQPLEMTIVDPMLTVNEATQIQYIPAHQIDGTSYVDGGNFLNYLPPPPSTENTADPSTNTVTELTHLPYITLTEVYPSGQSK